MFEPSIAFTHFLLTFLPHFNVQVLKSQLSKLGKKYNESILFQKKQSTIIEHLNKDKISLKKDLIQSKYEAKQNELLLKNRQNEIFSLKTELKAKGSLILTIEKERRRLEIDSRSPSLGISKRESRGRDQNPSHQRSMSVDRSDKRRNLARQLIKTGQGSAYVVTANIDSENLSEGEMDRVLVLTKLLLAKTRVLAEKDVQIESLSREKNQLLTLVSRLKRTKYLAEQLMDCRHKLAVKTNQLKALIKENDNNKKEMVNLRIEVAKLRDKLHELYTERTHYLKNTL